MSSDTGPAGPEPFEVVFSSEDACYYPEVSEILSELTPHVRSLLGDVGTLDQGDLYSLLDHLDADLSDEDCDRVNDALDQLRPHSDCSCASDRWPDEKYYFDELLLGLPDTKWAVDRSGDVLDDLEYPLDVEVLSNLVFNRNGWDSMELKWDGLVLLASFSSYGSGSWALRLRPLSEGQLEDAEVWLSSDSYETCVASRVLDTAPAVLEFAREILEVFEELEREEDLSDLVNALTAPSVPLFTPEQQEIVLGLAEGWEGDLPSLLETAVAVLPEAA